MDLHFLFSVTGYRSFTAPLLFTVIALVLLAMTCIKPPRIICGNTKTIDTTSVIVHTLLAFCSLYAAGVMIALTPH